MSAIDTDAFWTQRTEPLSALASFQKAMGAAIKCHVQHDYRQVHFYAKGVGVASCTHRTATHYTSETLGYWAAKMLK